MLDRTQEGQVAPENEEEGSQGCEVIWITCWMVAVGALVLYRTGGLCLGP